MRGSQSDDGARSFEADRWKRTRAGHKRLPRRHLFLKRLMTSCCVIAILTNTAHAGTAHLPVGADVAAGNASIASDGTNMLIDQTSASAVINWDGFSIGQGHQVTFQMPDRSAAVLNRVTGGEGSTIAGTLTGNGQVYLVNPNGIAITHSGTVKVGGSFTASTIDIKDEDFLRGRRRFSGRSSGKIKNSGSIETEDGGFVALLSNNGVDDDGVINVPAGKVALGVGSEITLDPTGTGFMQIAAPSTLADPEGVTMSGKIRAEGGRVEIKASAAGKVVRNLVNMSGEVNVSSVRKVGGTVIFDGGKGGVKVSGKVKASSQKKKGGTVRIGGDHILIAGADIDVKGKSGGAVSIGGGWHGAAVPGVTTAREALIDDQTTITATGAKGRGGDVTVWSDENTQFLGTITSMGHGGDGGDVEVSSHGTYRYDGHVNLLSDGGKAGTLLLDPYDLTISSLANSNQSGFAATGSGANINIATLSSTLNTASVNVTTGSSGSEAGDITLSAPLTWNAPTTLTLNAAGDLKINASITASNSGAAINLIAGGAGGINSASTNLFTYNNLTFTQTNPNANGSIGNIGGSGTVTYNGPASAYVGGIATPSLTFTVNTTVGGRLNVNSGVLSVGGANSFTQYDIKPGAVMQLDNSGGQRSFTYWSGTYTTITGGGTVQKTGTGPVYGGGGTSTIAVAMDPGGLIDIQGGLFNGGATGFSYTNNKGDLNVASGATFTAGSLNPIFDKLTGNGAITAGTTNSSSPSTFTIGVNNGSSTFLGGFASGAGYYVNLTKAGTGTITLGATSAHYGSTVVNGGTLKAGSVNGLSSYAALSIASGATVDLGGFNSTVTALSGAGTLTNSGASAAVLTTGSANTSTNLLRRNAGWRRQARPHQDRHRHADAFGPEYQYRQHHRQQWHAQDQRPALFQRRAQHVHRLGRDTRSLQLLERPRRHSIEHQRRGHADLHRQFLVDPDCQFRFYRAYHGALRHAQPAGYVPLEECAQQHELERKFLRAQPRLDGNLRSGRRSDRYFQRFGRKRSDHQDGRHRRDRPHSRRDQYIVQLQRHHQFAHRHRHADEAGYGHAHARRHGQLFRYPRRAGWDNQDRLRHGARQRHGRLGGRIHRDRSRRLLADDRLAGRKRRRFQQCRRQCDARHRRCQHLDQLLRHDRERHRHRQPDQVRHRHLHALRQQHLYRRDHDQWRHAAGGLDDGLRQQLCHDRREWHDARPRRQIGNPRIARGRRHRHQFVRNGRHAHRWRQQCLHHLLRHPAERHRHPGAHQGGHRDADPFRRKHRNRHDHRQWRHRQPHRFLERRGGHGKHLGRLRRDTLRHGRADRGQLRHHGCGHGLAHRREQGGQCLRHRHGRRLYAHQFEERDARLDQFQRRGLGPGHGLHLRSHHRRGRHDRVFRHGRCDQARRRPQLLQQQGRQCAVRLERALAALPAECDRQQFQQPEQRQHRHLEHELGHLAQPNRQPLRLRRTADADRVFHLHGKDLWRERNLGDRRLLWRDGLRRRRGQCLSG